MIRKVWPVHWKKVLCLVMIVMCCGACAEPAATEVVSVKAYLEQEILPGLLTDQEQYREEFDLQDLWLSGVVPCYDAVDGELVSSEDTMYLLISGDAIVGQVFCSPRGQISAGLLPREQTHPLQEVYESRKSAALLFDQEYRYVYTEGIAVITGHFAPVAGRSVFEHEEAAAEAMRGLATAVLKPEQQLKVSGG